MTGALAQTMPMFTSGLGTISSSLGFELAFVILLTVSSQRLLWQPLALLVGSDFRSRDCSNLQVRSGLVMKPDKAVRTVQQTAVLCIISETSLVSYAGSRT